MTVPARMAAQAQNMLAGGLAVVQGMMGGPQLWQRGVGAADRDAPRDECSMPPCKCCGIPLWFRDRDFAATGQKSVLKFKSCPPGMCYPKGWVIEDADILGVTATIEVMQPCSIFKCGAENCCEPEAHYTEGGKLVGRTRFLCYLCPECKCEDYPLTEALDGGGNIRFVRLGGSCCTRWQYRSESLRGNWMEVGFPVFRHGQETNRDPVAYLSYKYHLHPLCECCPAMICCRPFWNGINEFPNGMAAEEQKILVSMAMMRHHMIIYNVLWGA